MIALSLSPKWNHALYVSILSLHKLIDNNRNNSISTPYYLVQKKKNSRAKTTDKISAGQKVQIP